VAKSANSDTLFSITLSELAFLLFFLLLLISYNAIQEKEIQLADQQQTIDQQMATNKQLSDKVEQQAQQAQWEEVLTQQQALIAQREAELTQLQQQLAAEQQERVAQQEAELTQLQQQLAEQQERLAQREAELTQLQQQQAEQQERVAQQEAELTQLQQQLAQLQKALTSDDYQLAQLQLSELLRSASPPPSPRGNHPLPPAPPIDKALLERTFRKLVLAAQRLHQRLLQLQEEVNRQQQEKGVLTQQLQQALKSQAEFEQQHVVLAKAYEQVVLEREQIKQQLSTQQTQLQDSQGQVQNLLRRDRRGGLDHPPCWANTAGQIEYLLAIELTGDELAVSAIWPAQRTAQTAPFSVLHQMVGKRVSRQQFAQAAAPILTWSDQQQPACRHFVRIKDSKRTSKQDFKQSLQVIESYFYKYLER